MPISHVEIDSFRAFVVKQIHAGASNLTLEDCLDQWRAERERAETIAAVQEAVADYQAGRCTSLDQAMREIRSELGLPGN